MGSSEYALHEAFDDVYGTDVLPHSGESVRAHRLAEAMRRKRPTIVGVRVDTDDSYAMFRDVQRIPHLLKFHEVMRGLEDETVGLDEVLGALEEVKCCGQKVPLPLPAWANGKVDCWQDDGELFCTVRILGDDGRVRHVTGSRLLYPHTEEAVAYMDGIGANLDETIHAAPFVAQILGGQALLQEVCGAALPMAKKTKTRGNVYLHGCDVLASVN